jgi:hypothetical protein
MHRRHADRRPEISGAIHDALVAGWGIPADDLFHLFRLHDDGDLVFSRTYPDADRKDILYVQILAFAGASAEVKQKGATLIADNLHGLGLERDELLVAISENGDGDWFAPGLEH